ncbi:Eco57I restriction-modification methylase domain-containing protein [Leptolyngbya sp. FACHB-261]|uniref:Eco57I restriction-modification methylase domain-containing protein n=1 Tax=Leptolyngbya sp. FACHB-261 TaxID=2692806 RepID=UPI0018EF6F3A|nr:N-6 DNA methylase [Leptolyngbya sp. FACHB-261]
MWQGLRVTFQLFDENWRGQVLGLSPLDGDLFGSHTLVDLEGCGIDNHDLMLALRGLSLYEQKGQLRRVNYGALDVEELGSVYESLLEFHPNVSQVDGIWEFQLVTGSERKTTGSYYTPPELVGQLIKSALEPVIVDRLASLGSDATVEAQEQALLKLKVCDPACGSGHFLLAAARRIGKELARVRTGEMQPGAEPLRVAIRDVIQHCIYGVDLNPLAVDLCKVALWLEGLCRGLSLNFLDHRIKCGNSLVGVLDLDCLKEGIPDNAYKPVTGDDKAIASRIKKTNKKDLEDMQRGQLALELESTFEKDREEYARAWREIEVMKDDDPTAVHQKQKKYERSRHLVSWLRDRSACNLWTAAFFMPLTEQNLQLLPTSGVLDNLLKGNWATQEIVAAADTLADEKHFFHWPLEFPDVFEQGGFDCVLGNPPWERIKLQEKEFFAARDLRIVHVKSSTERSRLIEDLKIQKPELAKAYEDTKHDADAQGKFIRESSRFSLTAVGDINTYSVFSELAIGLVESFGRVGIVVPPGIASDMTTKEFFNFLIKKNRLCSLVSYVNERSLFQGVLHNFRFSLMSVVGEKIEIQEPDLAFECLSFAEAEKPERHFTLTEEELRLLNPNTLNCPFFRTGTDAEITKRIYQGIPIIQNEAKDENPWEISFARIFDMTNDSHLFSVEQKDDCVRLLEGKMIFSFDHRAASIGINAKNIQRSGQPIETTLEDHKDPYFLTKPQHWVSRKEVMARLRDQKQDWFIGFRSVTGPSNERTFVSTVIPFCGAGNSLPILLSQKQGKDLLLCLISNLNALVFDFVVKQKIGGVNLNFFIVKQLPVIPPDRYTQTDIDFIAPRVLELTYTAWDLQPFAQDMGYDGEPFIWNPERRALLRAELDAYYAHLYGLTRDELRYILNPADVHGPDFPSETFRVLKNNEIKLFGEYRTQRLVLAAWDQLFGSS